MSFKELKYCFFDEENLILKSKVQCDEFQDGYLSDFLWNKLDEYSDKVILVEGATGEEFTGEKFKEIVSQIALSLIDNGVKPQDIVHGFSVNSCLFAAVQVAVIAVGGVFTGCQYAHTVRENKYQVDNGNCKVVFTCQQLLKKAEELLKVCPQIHTLVVIDSESEEIEFKKAGQKVIPLKVFLNRQARKSDPQLPISLSLPAKDAMAYILYSSGSTGLPKGVIRTHANCIAMLTVEGPAGSPLGTSNDTVILHSAMVHGSGSWLLLEVIRFGMKGIVTKPFEVENFLKTVEKYRVTYAVIVPSHIVALTKSPLVESYDISSLRKVVSGGAPLIASTADQSMKVLGLEVLAQFYVSTEGGYVTTTTDDIKNPLSVGTVNRMNEVKVVDRETGTAVGPNIVGEIYNKGPEVCIGYLNNPQATQESITPDGWLKTGDAGYYTEEGLFYIVDRYKEVIKVDTQQVAPAELESILLTHDSIEEAAVVGIPDNTHGEIPKAFVVLKKECHDKANEEQIIEFVNKQVAECKQLRGGLTFIDSIPKISIGKVNRRALRSI